MKAKTLKLTPDMVTDLLSLSEDATGLWIAMREILREHKSGAWGELPDSNLVSDKCKYVYSNIKSNMGIYRKSNKALMSYRLDPNSKKDSLKNVERVLANDIGRSFGDLVVIDQDANVLTAKSQKTGKVYTYHRSKFEYGIVKWCTKKAKIHETARALKWSIAFDLFYKKLYLGFFLKHYRSTALALPFSQWSQHYFTQASEIQFKLLDENGIPQKFWQYYTGYTIDSLDPESQTPTPTLKLFDSPSYDHFAIPVYSESRVTTPTQSQT